MSLTQAYLVKTSGIKEFFEAIKNAQAPEKFTNKFLQDLGFKSTNDRLYIGILKALDFIDDAGVPTQRYYNYLDPGQSDSVLAEAIESAYDELFAINKKAYNLGVNEVKGKLKSLTQGSKSDSVLQNMARTFNSLTDLVDWRKAHKSIHEVDPKEVKEKDMEPEIPDNKVQKKISLNSELHYNIQIHLPATRDNAVYDAIFQSLKKHLLE